MVKVHKWTSDIERGLKLQRSLLFPDSPDMQFRRIHYPGHFDWIFAGTVRLNESMDYLEKQLSE